MLQAFKVRLLIDIFGAYEEQRKKQKRRKLVGGAQLWDGRVCADQSLSSRGFLIF